MLLEELIKEHTGIDSAELLLSQIITKGKMDNAADFYIVMKVMTFLNTDSRNPRYYMQYPVAQGVQETSSALKEYLKSLGAEDQVQLATYLLNCVKTRDTISLSSGMSIIDYMNDVLRRQH